MNIFKLLLTVDDNPSKCFLHHNTFQETINDFTFYKHFILMGCFVFLLRNHYLINWLLLITLISSTHSIDIIANTDFSINERTLRLRDLHRTLEETAAGWHSTSSSPQNIFIRTGWPYCRQSVRGKWKWQCPVIINDVRIRVCGSVPVWWVRFWSTVNPWKGAYPANTFYRVFVGSPRIHTMHDSLFPKPHRNFSCHPNCASRLVRSHNLHRWDTWLSPRP